jgi:4-hydroxyphenylacetate decarboxylase small subunit
MTKPASSHRACRNYAPVDVVKGICHRSKDQVQADDPGCANCVQLPACRHCAHFRAGEAEYLGTCHAQPRPAMAYPDMTAVACSWYEQAT